MKPIVTFLAVLSTIFLLMLTSEVLAQTSDAEPVCDGLLDETRGLYGLCLGFCEALSGETTIAVEEPSSYPTGANGLMFEKFSAVAGEGGPEMPCVKYIYGECPYWNVSPELKDLLASIISQMDNIEVTRGEEPDYYYIRITGTINGDPDIVELKGEKEDDGLVFPLVLWLHYPPDRITYFPGHNADKSQYERCAYDLEQLVETRPDLASSWPLFMPSILTGSSAE